MSVYIKGVEMPTNCSRQGCPLFACIAAYKTGMICTVLNEYVEKGKKNPRCPLIHVPPHGRLIDADAMIEDCHAHNSQRSLWGELEYLIDNAPTIIPAEEGEI